MNQNEAISTKKWDVCSSPMQMPLTPPNPAKEAEYAELHERKLFGILTFLGQISMKNFFVSVFKGKILSNELFFYRYAQSISPYKPYGRIKKNILNMVSLKSENCFAHILLKTPGYPLAY